MVKKILTAPVRFYKRWISPLLPNACRFEPTCSEYAISAIEKHGAKGLLLAAYRILRCNPFCEGGYDPVPDSFTFKKRKGQIESEEEYDIV